MVRLLVWKEAGCIISAPVLLQLISSCQAWRNGVWGKQVFSTLGAAMLLSGVPECWCWDKWHDSSLSWPYWRSQLAGSFVLGEAINSPPKVVQKGDCSLPVCPRDCYTIHYPLSPVRTLHSYILEKVVHVQNLRV